jgi:hypothetical protein
VNASNQQNVDASTPTLNFGYNPSFNNGSPRITYNMQATTGYGGGFALLQLINLANSFTLASNGHVGNQNTGANVYVLDTTPSNTIPQFGDTNGVVISPGGQSTSFTLNDGPFLGLTSNYASVTASENFQTYFMYQPQTAGAICVTLGLINWSWGGTATASNGSWSVSATSFTPSPAGATVMYTNSNKLPQWATNVTTVGIQ